MTQVNTPYAATPFLTGFLREQGIDAVQADLSLELVLRLFSREGLERVSAQVSTQKLAKIPTRYLATCDAVIRFLQGKDPTLAYRIASRTFLPEGPRFAALDELSNLGDGSMDWAFGAMGTQDFAKYLASLYLDDLADLIRDRIDGRYEFARYAEKLAASAPSFEPLRLALEGSVSTPLDRMVEELAREKYERFKVAGRPMAVAISVPFPGTVYAAFRIAKTLRRYAPEVKTILGGGYVSTELRALSDPRVFDYFDYICLDAGPRPLLNIVEHLQGKRSHEALTRTFVRDGGKVVFRKQAGEPDFKLNETGTPVFDGLPLDRYLSMLEMLNPMHRIWSDGRWNKIMLAQGCYWKRCAFCDVTLDYIRCYDLAEPDVIVDRMEKIMKETGQSGFHFVDEAAPPALLRSVAQKILERGLVVTWWGNVRFDRAFTPELVRLLARSGCIGVTAGLEGAQDRLLKLMDKGFTVEQARQVMSVFRDEGILVHAYLIYGLPTQTKKETIEALKNVRELFSEGMLQSAYWHRFSVTAHSLVGKNPEKYGIRILGPKAEECTFARNDLRFEDATGVDHDRLGEGLKKAVYNFMYGIGFERDVRSWFSRES